jgi:hypothetical protein
MTRARRAILLSAGCLLLFAPAAVVAAQDPSAGQSAPVESRLSRAGRRANRPPAPPNPGRMSVQQVEQYFEQVVLFQAQTNLQLNDDQFLRFGAGLKRLQAARRQHQRRRMMTLRDLNALVNASAVDEAMVTAKLKELDDIDAAAQREVQDAYAAIDQVLDLRQRVRFRVFDETMERRKLELLARARQAAGRAAGAPPAR